MKNDQRRGAPTPESLIWFGVVAGFSALAVQILISAFTDIPPLYSGLALAALYAAAATVLVITYRSTLHKYSRMHGRILKNGEVMTGLIEQLDVPAVITHDDGTVIWANKAVKELFGDEELDMFGKNMNRFCPFDVKSIKQATLSEADYDSLEIARRRAAGEPVNDPPEHSSAYATYPRISNDHGGLEYVIGGRRFQAKCYSVVLPAETGDGVRRYNLTIFDENTELFDLKDETAKKNLTVAYVVLDNLAELAEYVRVNYREAANNIELHIKDWAEQLGGVLCEYDRDKYMILFSQEMLEKTIVDGFPILEKIRTERLGDNSMSVTVSMGISSVGDTVAEREKNAKLALDTALRRGGDQIVVKKADTMDFYGGRSKGIQKREKVSSRVIAKRLREIIGEHSRVFVMGHRNPDCDSIGASVGMARFVKAVRPDVSVHVVSALDNDTFKACTASLLGRVDHGMLFQSAGTALDEVSSDSLLIIVDANNFNIIESNEIANSVSDIVIIDHHRKVSDLPRKILLEYIDPSASSASELVAEMIESEFSETTLLKEEADVMLSGIMLDTMNFTRTTGMRTFSAAYFLRAAGASSERARGFFRDDLEQHLAEAKFFDPENVVIYRDNIAIAVSMGSDERYDRIAASKAAERLISVREVIAAFALVKIGSSIHISARSTGTLNVQLILEALGGGGHFDSAGAQVTGRTMNEALVILKDAINNYLEQ